jgi:hypothetical protein
MILFLSYARKDQTHIGPLAQGLRFAGHDPWFDESLSGGEEWWRAILKRIRSSDVFVAVVSQASLASTACTREREYAVRLGKPILPVAVEDVPTQALPPDLARRQILTSPRQTRPQPFGSAHFRSDPHHRRAARHHRPTARCCPR